MDIIDLKSQLENEDNAKKRAELLAQLEVIKQNAEEQIRAEQKDVDFETKEFTVELLVNKYHSGLEDDTNELFVPDYQRDFVWSEKRQSRLIESLILGFPIPYIFTADVLSEDPDLDGRIEIVDGSQRVRLHQERSPLLRFLEILRELNVRTHKEEAIFYHQPYLFLEYILKKVGKVRILPILLQTHHHKASAVPLLLL